MKNTMISLLLLISTASTARAQLSGMDSFLACSDKVAQSVLASAQALDIGNELYIPGGIQMWGPNGDVFTFNVKVFGDKKSDHGPFVFGSSAQAKVRFTDPGCEILELSIVTGKSK